MKNFELKDKPGPSLGEQSLKTLQERLDMFYRDIEPAILLIQAYEEEIISRISHVSRPGTKH